MDCTFGGNDLFIHCMNADIFPSTVAINERNNSTLGAVKSVREVWYAHVCGNEAFIHCMNTDAIPCTVAIEERGIRTEQLE